MDFTTQEKKMIVYALTHAYGEVTEAINIAALSTEKGVRYEGEALDRLTKYCQQREAVLVLEGKIFNTIDDDDSKEALVAENQGNLEVLKAWKVSLGISEDAREPEAVNS